MAILKTDSPISRRIVLAFLDFLNSVEPNPGADLEGLEVVCECLEDIFKLNSSSIDEQIQPGLLVDYFRSLDRNKQPDPNLGSVTIPDAPTTSSQRDINECLSQIPKEKDADLSGESHTSGLLKDELFGQFFAALDKIHFFSSTVDGEDDRGQLDRATNFFHKAVTDLEASGCKTIDPLSLSEMFKSQGNKAMQSKLYSDAVELYTYAIALCPNNSVYYCNRAAAFTQIKQYTEATRDCNKSIEIDPNYSKAYSRLGLIYYAQGNYRHALDKGFNKALQLDPDNDSVKENIKVAEQKLRAQSANGGGSSRTFTSTSFNSGSFNPGDLSSDITNMIMNMVGGQNPQRRNNDEGEPGIRLGGDININFGEDMPEEIMGTLNSVMGMFASGQPNPSPQSGQPNQSPHNADTHRGPTPN